MSARWEIRPYNTPTDQAWVILRDSKAVAEVYDRQDAEFVLAALQSRGQDNAAGLRSTIQALSHLDAQGRPRSVADLQAQGYLVDTPKPGEWTPFDGTPPPWSQK